MSWDRAADSVPADSPRTILTQQPHSMVALLNGTQGVLEWSTSAVDDEEEFVLPGLANDRLRLQAADIDACRGEDTQYLK